jgi:hypothetical protein
MFTRLRCRKKKNVYFFQSIKAPHYFRINWNLLNRFSFEKQKIASLQNKNLFQERLYYYEKTQKIAS